MKLWTKIIIVALIGSFGAYKIFFVTEKAKNIASAETKDFYWTCPMHPQINMDHPSDCPICHMKLVKVEKQNESADSDEAEKRTSVQANTYQLELIGIQKVEARKMNLTMKVPISGRILSSSSLAFQVYESDLKYMKVGHPFVGEDSISSEEISGRIASIDSIIDPTSRTVRVVGAILKGPRSILPETSFRGEVQITLSERVTIPEDSVLHTGRGGLVYLVDKKNKLSPKKVKLGVKAEGYYEVLAGLEVGDVISSGPNFLIDSEAKIRGAND